MAKYKVDISNYDAFCAATNGKRYDVDGVYGAQCVDSAKLLWEQLGRACSTGGTGGAYGCWTAARTANAGKDFDLITDKAKIKRGDVVVWGEGLCKYGHIGFADADYTAGAKLPCYSQNQGGTDGQGAASAFCIKSYATTHILGAFRLKKWNAPAKPAAVKKGDIVQYRGGYHYASSNAEKASGAKRTAGKATVEIIAAGAKHPYHLIGVSGGSNVHGWVDAADIEGAAVTAPTPAATPAAIQAGSRVKVKAAAKQYARSTVKIPDWVKKELLTVASVGADDVLLKEINSYVKKIDVEVVS